MTMVLLSIENIYPLPDRSSAYRHFPRRPDWQFQHLAQCAQVTVPWPNAVVLPEVYARRADAYLLGNFGHRQTTLDPSVAEVTSEIGLAGQCSDLQGLEMDNILTDDLSCKLLR